MRITGIVNKYWKYLISLNFNSKNLIR